MEPEGVLLLEESVAFVANRLSLDFVNTACRRHAAPMELLSDVATLTTWLRAAERRYDRRIDPGGTPWHANLTEEDLRTAKDLRITLWEWVNAILRKRPPQTEAVDALNALLKEGAVYSQIAFADGRGYCSLHQRESRPSWLLEIARDAADLFCAGDLSLLKQCEGETCVRVFYDTTKNHTRRWCVEKCGSRVKAANYYRRKREALASASRKTG